MAASSSVESRLVRVATVLRVTRPASTPASPQSARKATGRRRPKERTASSTSAGSRSCSQWAISPPFAEAWCARSVSGPDSSEPAGHPAELLGQPVQRFRDPLLLGAGLLTRLGADGVEQRGGLLLGLGGDVRGFALRGLGDVLARVQRGAGHLLGLALGRVDLRVGCGGGGVAVRAGRGRRVRAVLIECGVQRLGDRSVSVLIEGRVGARRCDVRVARTPSRRTVQGRPGWFPEVAESSAKLRSSVS